MRKRSVLKIVLLAVVVAWVVAVTAAFALRHGDRPAHADAVVVLQGSNSRLPEGLKLIRAGYAPLLVVSRGDHEKLDATLCAPHQTVVPARVVCFDADPTSTRGEARFIARLARKEGLASIAVVTSQFHVFRARMIVARCFPGDLRMVGTSQPAWKFPWFALSETVKYTYAATVARGC
jgi:uncharacterized SAM-binding protein YcdF (DUF218 family)